MKMTLLTVVLAAALAGCAGTQSQKVATANTGGRANETRVYSLTGEQPTEKVSNYHNAERSTLPRPN